jgi:hypothetical protein
MAAVAMETTKNTKNLKCSESDDLFLCQVSKGSTVWSKYNIFCTLVTMATVAILNFVNPSKAATDSMKRYYDIGTKMQNFDKGSPVWLHNPHRTKGLSKTTK